MKENFDYASMPVSFTHCLNDQCTRGEQCLRRRMALLIPPGRGTVNVVNPFTNRSASGEDCPYFLEDKPQRFARGITHLLSRIPHEDAVVIKKQIFARLGRNFYYRSLNKERLIRPNEQEAIARMFREQGLTDPPVFDEYVDYYELTRVRD